MMADTGVAMPAAQIARAWLQMARSKGFSNSESQGSLVTVIGLNREIIVKKVWQGGVGRVGASEKERERERERECTVFTRKSTNHGGPCGPQGVTCSSYPKEEERDRGRHRGAPLCP